MTRSFIRASTVWVGKSALPGRRRWSGSYPTGISTPAGYDSILPSQRLPLFDSVIVQNFIQSSEQPEDTDTLRNTIRPWATNNRPNLGELSLEQAFNSDIFGTVLDYNLARPDDDEFQFLPKQQAEAGSGFPDFLMGHFVQNGNGELERDERVAVGELKGPGMDLDGSGGSGEGIESPVEQAFDYSNKNGLGLRWVIISNMTEIRLYHQGSIEHYEHWMFEDFLDEGELTEEFWNFYHLLHRDTLLGTHHEGSQLETLFERDLSERLELTENFYEFYREAVEDVYDELARELPDRAADEEGRIELIRASQKLMHRGIIICIFSDRGLLPPNILPEILDRGRSAPTMQDGTIHTYLKNLFRAIDTGSTDHFPFDVFGYDGGLFEQDPILTEAILSDEIFSREYDIGDDTIDGLFGFHTYDFRDDLNEFVLGRIFEESIADFEQIHDSVLQGDEPFTEAEARENYGIYFTREGLTEFVSDRVMSDILQEKRTQLRMEFDIPETDEQDYTEDLEFLRAYLHEILNIRIADLSCGSGAFLVSCFSHLQQEAEAVHNKLMDAARGDSSDPLQTSLGFEPFDTREQEIIEECLYGNDILQEAVEICKLSVWIRSAKEDVSLGMLTGNFASNDALAGEIEFDHGDETNGFGDFDLIIGNPPWGGEVNIGAERWLDAQFDEFDVDNLDTYELFTLVGLQYLKDDGRLAFVLPQTILRPEHDTIREHLLANYTFERFHIMGADWFGSDIRMSTTTLQIKNQPPAEHSTFRSMTLVDNDRRQAIEGTLSLTQLESAYSFDIPQRRCIDSGEIEPFRYQDDDRIIQTMEANSIPMGAVCTSKRGVEVSRSGRLIKCPGCFAWIKPPRGREPDTEKTCAECGHEFDFQERLGDVEIVKNEPSGADVPFLTGDAQGGRYETPELQGIDLGYETISYKDEELYTGDSLYIREAGVGLSVSYFAETVYCPRSVYVFTIRGDRTKMLQQYDPEQGWAAPERVPEGLDTTEFHKFLFGVLNSRIIHYYVFKRFSSIDAAEAFANFRLTDVRSFPIPVAKLSTDEGRELATEIASCVDNMLAGDDLGGATDRQIERNVQQLYGLEAADVAYVNKQMGLVGYHQAMQQLYPDGPPPKPERKETVSLTTDGSD